MKTDDELFTTNEAAAFMKLHPHSFRRIAKNLNIPFLALTKSGRSRRYRKSDLLKLNHESKADIQPSA